MKKFLLSIAALSTIAAAPAMAADLGVRPVYKAAPIVEAYHYSWSGCYIGVNGGGLRNNSQYTLRPTGDFLVPPRVADNPLRTDSANLHDTAGTIGGTVGCNWQTGMFVWGLEGDFNWSSLSQTDTVNRALAAPLAGNFVHTVTQKIDWFSTARGRLGWAAGDRWFVYATGGAAFANVKSTSALLFTLAGDNYSGTESQSKIGWTVGGGLEVGITNNWSFKGEYLYVDLGKRTYSDLNVPPPAFPTLSYATDISARFHVVRAGLNYRFGGPVAAAY